MTRNGPKKIEKNFVETLKFDKTRPITSQKGKEGIENFFSNDPKVPLKVDDNQHKRRLLACRES